MRSITLFSFFLLFFSSCLSPLSLQNKKCEKANQKFQFANYKYGCPWQISDTVHSTSYIERFRDTIIYVQVKADSVKNSIAIDALYPINTPVSTLETRFALSKAWITNNILNHILLQKETLIHTIIPNAFHSVNSSDVKIIKVPLPVDRPVPRQYNFFEKLFFFSGILLWLLLIAALIYKIK